MVRVGLIGCGRIGRVHADSIAVSSRAELAHVVDPFESSAREVGEQFSAPWSTDVEDVLGDTSIDAVVVASPTPTHVDLLTRAVRTRQGGALREADRPRHHSRRRVPCRDRGARRGRERRSTRRSPTSRACRRARSARWSS